jgi:drug/metabolite transporter (DMT)-like permease
MDRQILGMLCVAFGITWFSLHDAILKGLSGGYPVHEIFFVRSVVALPILWLIARVEGARAAPRQIGLHALRGLVLFFSFTVYYLGLARLPLAENIALFFSAPLFVALLSNPFLGERVEPRGWAAIGIGFLGVLVVLRPGFAALDPAALLPVLSAFAYSLSSLFSRQLGRTESGGAMAISATIVYLIGSAIAGLLLGRTALAPDAHPSLHFLLSPWTWPDARGLAIMATLGMISAFGFFFVGQGYRLAQPNRAAPFEYVALPWGVLWGYLFFGNPPDAPTVLGGLVIVSGGLYTLRLARARDRALSS